MEPDTEPDDKPLPLIKIIVINGVSYVWEASEWLSMRRDHRICGSFDGALVPSTKAMKGTMYPSLPVRLSRNEAQYMVKNGIASAFELPVLKDLSPRITKEQVGNLSEERRKEQLVAHRNKRRMQIESMVDKIIDGKRKKGRGIVPDRNTVIQEEMQKVVLPFETTQIDLIDPWIKKADYIPCEIPEPETLLDKLRYRVFEDFLLRRKYYMTSGIKFGGDFLAYPGDPTRTHSQFIILCIADTGKQASSLKSHIRLANVVKKIFLVATFNSTKDKVRYKAMNAVSPSKKQLENEVNQVKSDSNGTDAEMMEPELGSCKEGDNVAELI